jgi:hypothetical protein
MRPDFVVLTPLPQASKTKSEAHRYPAPVAGNGLGRPVAIRRRGRSLPAVLDRYRIRLMPD